MRISAERKRREVDPTIELLGRLKAQIEGRKDVPEHVRLRIGRMHEFISTLTGWYDQVRRLPKPTLVALMKLGGKVARFIPGGRKIPTE